MQGDKILLQGMEFYAYHGVNESEKSQGQRFIVDVEMTADLGKASESDDLEDTVDYSRVFRVVKEVVEGPSRDLIEAVAGEIARRTLESFAVERIMVRVSKPDVPLKGAVLRGAAVEIHRSRDTGHGGSKG